VGKGSLSAENNLFARRPPAESDLVPRRPAPLTCPPNLSSFAKELSRRAVDAVPWQGSGAELRRGIDAVPRRGASTLPQRGAVVGVLLWRRDVAAGWRLISVVRDGISAVRDGISTVRDVISTVRDGISVVRDGISVAGLLWRHAPVQHEKLSWRHEIQREESLRLCGRGRWRWAQLDAFSVLRRWQWAQRDFFKGLGWGRRPWAELNFRGLRRRFRRKLRECFRELRLQCGHLGG